MKVAKRYSSLKSVTNDAKVFLFFLLYGLHDVDFFDVSISTKLNFNKFVSFSLTWDPIGAKYSTAESFQTARDFFPNGPHETTLGFF